MKSDWLSPILIKELRQGLRARVFEGSFILLQVLMVLTLIGSLIAQTDRSPSPDDAAMLTGLFWTMVGIPVLVVMPLRGAGALRGEIDGNTLELMFLTRLSSWRIVVGKWAALFAQTCLLVCAVLPYIMLRYFLGAVELVMELRIAFFMLALSGLLMGLTVALSAFRSRVMRGISYMTPFLLLWLGPAFYGILFAMRSAGFARGPGLGWMAAALVFGFIVLLYCFEVGAARIGPAAENHETRKRLLGLLALMLGIGAVLLGADAEVHYFTFALILPVCLDALCRPWQRLPVLAVPFQRRGVVGRILGWLFLPGWPTGVFYTFFMFGAVALLWILSGLSTPDGGWTFFFAALALLLLPTAIMGNQVLRTEHLGATYIGVLMGLVCAGGTALALLSLYAAFHPMVFDWIDTSFVLAASMLGAGLVASILFVRRGPFWREIVDVHAEAATLLRPREAAAALADDDSMGEGSPAG